MPDIKYFPALKTHKTASEEYEVITGITLESILKKELCSNFWFELEKQSTDHQSLSRLVAIVNLSFSGIFFCAHYR